MKWSYGHRMRLRFVGCVIAVVLGCGENVMADFTFERPTNMGSVNSPRYDYDPTISSDGLELYFMSSRDGGQFDIYVSTRASTDDDWGDPVNLGPNVNSAGDEYFPRLSPNGLELYFDSNRAGGQGSWDAWVSRRTTGNSAWGPAESFGPPVNTAGSDGTVWITDDGLELYFSSGRPSGYSPAPIYVSTRARIEDDWEDPVRLGPQVEGPSVDFVASVSTDGLALFINEDELLGSYRSNGLGGGDIWISTRANLSSPWGIPVNLGPIINTSDYDASGFVSPDGSMFYFSSQRAGGYGGSDLWQARILPVVDFTGDYQVDIKDLLMLIEHWGQDEPMCDMAPMPWGDGIVDANDLEVLMSYWGQEVYDPHFIAHWTLDEIEGTIAHDSIAENHGLVMGDALWQSDEGQVGGAIQLDGIHDYVDTPFVLNPREGVFSVFAWVKGVIPGEVIIAQNKGTDWLLTDDQGCLMTALVGSGGRGYDDPLISETTVTDGNWHRVGLVWDCSYRSLYVDDELVAIDVAEQHNFPESLGGLYIGAAHDRRSSGFWSGLIDDVRIYNRVVMP